MLSIYHINGNLGHLQRIIVANNINSQRNGFHQPLQNFLIYECWAIVPCHHLGAI